MPLPSHAPAAYPDKLPFRTYVYVSPVDDDGVQNAYRSGADAVALDLEDLTPDGDKDRARAVVDRLRSSSPPLPTVVRINASASDEVVDTDLEAVVGSGIAAVRLPKSEDPHRIRDIAGRIEELRIARGLVATIGLQVVVETSRGIENLHRLARATHTVWSLGIGEGDLKAELGTGSDAGLAFARSSVVVAARSAHLPPPVQVAFPADGSVDDLRRSTELGRSFGFGARNLLNPDHVPVVHAIYPARASLAQAA
jgi:citrate lyase subunit beta/citryl-CoA lyase